MKLRINGNSMRLRVSQSDLALLLRELRVEETIRFGPAPDAKLTYALAIEERREDISLYCTASTVTIAISTGIATRWASTQDVGIYGDVDTGENSVALIVEKDFACLDGNDPQDADAFPNPHAGVAC